MLSARPKWSGGDGDVNNHGNWTDTTTVPTENDVAEIDSGVAWLHDHRNFGALDFKGGSLKGTTTILTLGNSLTAFISYWRAGTLTFTSGGGVVVSNNATLIIVGAVDTNRSLDGATITNYGTVDWQSGRIRAGAGGGVVNHALFKDTTTVDTLFSDLSDTSSDSPGSFTNLAQATFRKTGTSTTTFTDVAFNNSGLVQVDAGILRLEAGGAIGAGAQFLGSGQTVLAGGTFTAAGEILATGLVLDGATLTGNITLGSSSFEGEVTYRSGTVDGSITNHIEVLDLSTTGTIGSSGNVTFTNASTGLYHKKASGTTTFAGTFTNNGVVGVGTGRLIFSGSFTNQGSVVVYGGGTVEFANPVSFPEHSYFGGAGTVVSSAIAAGGIVFSNYYGGSLSAGPLNLTGDLTLLSTSAYLVQIAGLAQGSQYSFLDVSGNVHLDGGNLYVAVSSGFAGAIAPTDTFTILAAAGTNGVTGTFGNLLNGRVATTTGGSFLVTVGGNQVSLSDFRAIPEPSTYVLLGIGAAALIGLSRRRRAR